MHANPPIYWRAAAAHTPEPNKRVLVFSPEYEEGHVLRLRVMPGGLLKTASEAGYWVYCEEVIALGEIDTIRVDTSGEPPQPVRHVKREQEYQKKIFP